MANRYGEAALMAVRMDTYGKAITPRERWEHAVKALYPNTPAGQKKSAPRLAFLSLCNGGLIEGITSADHRPAGNENSYATRAVALLAAGTHKTVTELWKEVTKGEDIPHASQMDVVLALWKNNLLTPGRPDQAT